MARQHIAVGSGWSTDHPAPKSRSAISTPRLRGGRLRLKGRVVRTNICDMFALPRRTSCTCTPGFHPSLRGGYCT